MLLFIIFIKGRKLYRLEIILTIMFILILSTGIMMDIKDAGHFFRSGRFNYLKDVAFYYAFVLDKIGIES